MPRPIPGYARIRINPTTSCLVKIEEEKEGRIRGYRVTQRGERWRCETASVQQEEIITCSVGDVVERLALNTYYGALEPLRG